MRKTPAFVLTSVVTVVLLAVLLLSHMQWAPLLTSFALLHTFLFLHLALKVTASIAAKPHTVAEGADLDSLTVDVVVPIYNEDPALLAAGIRGLAAQTRQPRAVWLIDDGSQRDGAPVPILTEPEVLDAIAEAEAAGIRVEAHRQVNKGKRWAQSTGFARSDADIFVTIDSDTYLDPHAVEKLLVPFSRESVASVAGLACGQNYRKSLLTRAIDIGFTMSFIQGRMAEGYFGQVRVNCGIIAAYRGEVVRDNLHRYLNQRFLGLPVKAGDDRALTFFAKERGRTEFQPEAIAYSALPERLSHLVRQRMRWARSWVWGSFWLLRRPVLSADFLFTFTQLLGILGFGVVLTLGVTGSALGAISPMMLVNLGITATVIGAVVHLRYLVSVHTGDPFWQRLATWLCSPIGTLLYVGLFLPLYWVAMFRPRPQQTWGTRQQVEVGLHAPALTQHTPALVGATGEAA